METNILKSVKKTLGIEDEYKAFDYDIMVHINAAFAQLNDLGIGPNQGYMLEDENATWADFFGANEEEPSVRSLVYLKVRLAFDPPSTSYAIAAFEKQIDELVWRINVRRENREWLTPIPGDLTGSELILDGGDADV